MSRRQQEDHADLGLVNDDRTEDLRPHSEIPRPTPGDFKSNPTHPERGD